MSTRTILMQGGGWRLIQELVDGSIELQIDKPKGLLRLNGGLTVVLPDEIIDAIARLKETK